MLSSSGSRSGTDVRNGAIVVKIVRARFENEPSTSSVRGNGTSSVGSNGTLWDPYPR